MKRTPWKLALVVGPFLFVNISGAIEHQSPQPFEFANPEMIELNDLPKGTCCCPCDTDGDGLADGHCTCPK